MKKYTVLCNHGEYARGIFDTEEQAGMYLFEAQLFQGYWTLEEIKAELDKYDEPVWKFYQYFDTDMIVIELEEV